MTYLVTGALAVLRDDLGKLRYCYQGAVVPESIPATDLNRFVELGLIKKLDEPRTTPQGGDPELRDTGKEPKEPATTPPAGSVTAQRPLQVAAKSAWVDYAVACGMDRVAAEAMSKADLISALPPLE